MEELAAVEACSPAELPLLGSSGIVLANGISNPNMSVVPSFPINGDHAPTESLEASKPDSTCAGAVDCKKGISEAYTLFLAFSLEFNKNHN